MPTVKTVNRARRAIGRILGNKAEAQKGLPPPASAKKKQMAKAVPAAKKARPKVSR